MKLLLGDAECPAKDFAAGQSIKSMFRHPRSTTTFPTRITWLFVRDFVRTKLDLSEIKDAYAAALVRPAYDPTMMTALIIYAYCLGMHSSREIANACHERPGFKALTGNQKPNFRTADRFRSRHLAVRGGLFDQVLEHCLEASFAPLDHVALDCARIQANASKHKAMSYGRMAKAEPASLKAPASKSSAADSN